LVSVAWPITRLATIAITQDCTVRGPTYSYRTYFISEYRVFYDHCVYTFCLTKLPHDAPSFFIAPPTTPFLLNPSQQRVTASPLSESDCQHLKANGNVMELCKKSRVFATHFFVISLISALFRIMVINANFVCGIVRHVQILEI